MHLDPNCGPHLLSWVLTGFNGVQVDAIVPAEWATCQYYDTCVELLLSPLECLGETPQLISAGGSIVEGKVQDTNVTIDLLVPDVPECNKQYEGGAI
jgi:hypothetical protein